MVFDTFKIYPKRYLLIILKYKNLLTQTKNIILSIFINTLKKKWYNNINNQYLYI